MTCIIHHHIYASQRTAVDEPYVTSGGGIFIRFSREWRWRPNAGPYVGAVTFMRTNKLTISRVVHLIYIRLLFSSFHVHSHKTLVPYSISPKTFIHHALFPNPKDHESYPGMCSPPNASPILTPIHKVDAPGGPEVNVLREIPVPTPKPDEVLIKVQYT